MDFSVLSILEHKLSHLTYATVEQLKKVSEKTWREIIMEKCVNIVEKFKKRLDACIKCKGGDCEHVL
ncbi:hypothetical protein WH47_06917 [Habropoda laboriosa]|uniref:Uncharacterized protein n=1 Tax=Habropoda laboriosa TaxID=597456 RepID=A0A0L7QQH8_9HYME|nr:hypothetical protein WH47_06917 [Habropoda laboriosa]